jgi:hypothetical protein
MKLMARVWGALFVVTLCCAPDRAAAVVDEVFQANFESPPDCLPVGATGCPGFTIQTPAIQIAGGQAIAYCYYFRTPNTGTIGIGRFSSRFDAVAAHVIVYATFDNSSTLPADRQTPGTVSSSGCGFAATANNTFARRIYSAHEPVEDLRMPSDDGAGKPVAIELPANSAGFIEMYFVNAGRIRSTHRLR